MIALSVADAVAVVKLFLLPVLDLKIHLHTHTLVRPRTGLVMSLFAACFF